MLSLLPQPFVEGRSQKEVVGSLKRKVWRCLWEATKLCYAFDSFGYWQENLTSWKKNSILNFVNICTTLQMWTIWHSPLLIILDIFLSLGVRGDENSSESLACWYKADAYKRTHKAGCNWNSYVVRLYSLKHLLRDTLPGYIPENSPGNS